MDLRGQVLRSTTRGIPLLPARRLPSRVASHAWHGGFWRANAGRGLLGLHGIVACPAFESSNHQALRRGNLTLLGAHHSTVHSFLPGGADSIGVSFLLCHNQASSAGPPLKPFSQIIFVRAFGVVKVKRQEVQQNLPFAKRQIKQQPKVAVWQHSIVCSRRAIAAGIKIQKYRCGFWCKVESNKTTVGKQSIAAQGRVRS
jgi:hypothetical protein